MTRNDSATNQRILRKLVDREVIMNASMLVSDLQEFCSSEFNNRILLDEEAINLSIPTCPECGDTNTLEKVDVDETTIKAFTNPDKIEFDVGDDLLVCHSCSQAIEAWEEPEDYSEYQDVFEWWFVSQWAMNKLEERGQVVWDSPYGCLWGRCTTGQAILLDSVWCNIAYDMEILEGQSNSWEGK